MTTLLEEGLIAKLLSRCKRQGQCLIWTGGKTSKGYGELWYRDKRYSTHRLAFLAFKGEIPIGYMVCHTCDNPPCIEPSHLFTGTAKDNLGDMARKGRAAKGDRHGSHVHPESRLKGEKHKMAKLTDAQVATIRQEHKSGVSMYRIAKNLGVSDTHIGRIVHYKSRK